MSVGVCVSVATRRRPPEHTYVWLDIFAVPQATPDHSSFLQEVGPRKQQQISTKRLNSRIAAE
jgi:hypothetical protein